MLDIINKEKECLPVPKIIESHERVEIENGETRKSIQSITKRYEDEPEYVKLYLDTVLYLKDLPKGYNSILMSFLKHMTYANYHNRERGQIIYVNASMKKAIAKDLQVSVARINQALTDFTKGELFQRIDTGTYRVNAHLFGKGNWEDIKELRMQVTFNAEGKTVMTEIEKAVVKKASLKIVASEKPDIE